MRQIKFRGKHTKIGEWIYGSLLIAQDGCCNIYDGLLYHKVKANTVGQFTGLLDKNGKEIYEGDIFVSDYMSLVFYVGYENGKWVGMDSDGNWMPLLEDQLSISDRLHYIKVIGNIHDNPELIK